MHLTKHRAAEEKGEVNGTQWRPCYLPDGIITRVQLSNASCTDIGAGWTGETHLQSNWTARGQRVSCRLWVEVRETTLTNIYVRDDVASQGAWMSAWLSRQIITSVVTVGHAPVPNEGEHSVSSWWQRNAKHDRQTILTGWTCSGGWTWAGSCIEGTDHRGGRTRAWRTRSETTVL
jgi:hypothetical protein